jgi:hypothetical protein
LVRVTKNATMRDNSGTPWRRITRRMAVAIEPCASNYGFGRSNLKTLDPDQWTRLKLEYERKCYQNAEKIVRERLRLLQVATRCEAEPARQ